MSGILLNPTGWTNSQCLSLQQNTNHSANPDYMYIKNADIAKEYNMPNRDLLVTGIEASTCRTPYGPLCASSPTSTREIDFLPIKSEFLAKRAKRMSRIYTDDTDQHLEALKVEQPLIEYLTMHGAINEADGIIILNAPHQEQRHLLFSALGLIDQSKRMVDTSSSVNVGFSLLLNALRNTGHLSLASYLDCSRRILPAESLDHSDKNLPYKASTFHRKRGQFSVWIQLDAVKVTPSVYEHIKHHNLPNHHYSALTFSTVNSEQNCLSRSSAVLPSFVAELQQRKTSSFQNCATNGFPVPNYWIDHTSVKEDKLSTNLGDHEPWTTNSDKPTGWFAKLLCIFGPRRKKSSASQKTAVIKTKHVVKSKLGDKSTAVIDNNRNTLQANLRAYLKNKTIEFCATTSDPTLPYNDAIVKYFEQSSGVLVLECQQERLSANNLHSAEQDDLRNDAVTCRLCVIVVATKTETIARLTETCGSYSTRVLRAGVPVDSKLALNLRLSLINAGLLDCLQLEDISLTATVDPTEVAQATNELEDMVD